MLTLTTRVAFQPNETVVSSAVARDIALVAGAIMRLPNPPVLHFTNTKSANPDIHVHGVVRGSKIIHRDRHIPFTDEYLMVTFVRRFGGEDGMNVEITARPYHDPKGEIVRFVMPASRTVELFTIEELR